MGGVHPAARRVWGPSSNRKVSVVFWIMASDPSRELLRHSLATIAYRGNKTLRDVPETFADFSASHGTRTPVQILAHMGDLFDWSLTIAQGEQKWHGSKPLAWADEICRFFETLGAFDKYLASDAELHAPADKLLQAPIADALTHIGQIAILRRIAGFPLLGENFYVAKIAVGNVSADQVGPVKEFS